MLTFFWMMVISYTLEQFHAQRERERELPKLIAARKREIRKSLRDTTL
jgi:hypothetical protein